MTLAEILKDQEAWVAAGADAVADIAEEEDVLVLVGVDPRVWEETLTLGCALRSLFELEEVYA